MLQRALLVASIALPTSPEIAAQEPAPPPPDESEGEAEEGDEGTIVIARKRPEPLEDVPQSVTVIDGEELEEAGIDSVRDASFLVPNLNVTEFSSRRLSFPFLRGIGSGQGEPAVLTYVDGVPQLTVGSTNLPLLDLERIEFLRGPQGTLYGRNALGGVIHLISERPTEDPVFDAGATFGNYDLHEYRLSYMGPVAGDDALFSLSTQYSARDGYTENDFTGGDVDDRESFFGRAQVYLAPSERSELRVGVYGERSRDGGFVLSDLEGLRERPHRINQDFEGVAERDLVSPSVAYDYAGEAVEFSSITAFTDWDVLETSDFDFSPIDGVRRRTTEAQEYFYQELRLQSAEGREIELGEETTLGWLVGLSGFAADSDRSAANEFRPDGAGVLFPPEAVGTDTSRGDFDDVAGAAFAQVTVTQSEKLELTGGLRYDRESKEADLRRTFETGGFTVVDERASLDEDFDDVLPSLSAAYHASEETMVYASAAKGFKAGGFNLSAPEDELTFGPEESWTYELGLKRSLADDRVRLAFSLFWIDWEEMQLSLFDAMSGGYVDNAGESTSRGAELELSAAVRDDVDLFAGIGYADTEFDEFTDPFGEDVSGNSLAFAPEETWHVGAQYDGGGADGLRWFLRGEYVGVGTFYYDAGNRESESYQLANFRAGVRKDDWRATLWVRNAFDEEYVPIAFQPSPASPDLFVGESGAPQTFGVTLRLSF